ncbi:MAG: ATP/maltotriose-dependent transcriptional regulator MalT, partial [Myxococcota bacterium]
DWRQAATGELKLGRALRRLGEKEAGEQLIRGVLARARARADRAILIDALHQLAAIAWEEGDLDRCEQLAGQGLIAASGPSLSGSRAQILLALTSVQAIRGQLAAATSGMVEAEGILKRLNRKQLRATVLNNIAELYIWQGALTEALARADEARALSREVLHREAEGTALRIRAMARLEIGDLAGAETDLGRSLAMAEEMALSEDIVASRYLYGRLSVRRGQAATARTHLQAGLVAARQQDPELYAPLLQALLAWCWCVLDRAPVARKLLDNLQVRQETLPDPRRSEVCLWMAQARMALGEHSAALLLAEEANRRAVSSGLRLTALRAKGLLCQLVPMDEAPAIAAAGRRLLRDIEAGSPPGAAASLRAEDAVAALLETST